MVLGIGLAHSALVSAHDGDTGQNATIAVVGDVILGGPINATAAERGPHHVLGALEQLSDADLALANLESVATSAGVRHVQKSELVPYYFRARPETLAVLASAGIDAVATANNHTGDYGPAAMLEQNELLERMAIATAGSGSTRAKACAPIYLDAGDDLRVAFFSVDATEPHFSAEDDRPGTCYLRLGDRAAWTAQFADAISEANRFVHAVLFAVHWGDNWKSEPTSDKRIIGRHLIDLGVDAVLGSNAHVLQGIEAHGDGLILHDLGHAVAPFDEPADAAIATLNISTSGVDSLRIVPIVADPDRARPATAQESNGMLGRLADQSARLDTSLAGDRIDLEPAPRRDPPEIPDAVVAPASGARPQPAASPPPGCIVDAVPEWARIEPIRLGPLTLIGATPLEDHYVLPALVRFDTYWTIDAPVASNFQLVPYGLREDSESDLWISAHDPCDWAWPTSRWKPGVIYRDEAALRPPPGALSPQGAATLASGFGGPLSVSMGVARHGSELDRSTELAKVGLGLPTLVRGAVAVGALALILGAVILVVYRRRRRSRATLE